jgi:flavin-dependent thymidylate synthase
MLHNNTVQLIGHYGSDEIHALSAWTSTSRELSDSKVERIPALLNMLAKEGHHTPFEKSCFHFLVTTDVASHIHLIKHRINVSVNAESARYKELKEDKYYIPYDWPDNWKNKLEEYTAQGNKLYHEAIEDLTKQYGFDRKRAKESARFFKTYNSQITSDVMFNFRSFNHFLSLRKTEHAQKEIFYVASDMLNLVKNIPSNPFKFTLAAFGY